MKTPTQDRNEIILLKYVNNEDISPFHISELEIALNHVRGELTIQPILGCRGNPMGKPVSLIFEWLNGKSSLNATSTQLLIEVYFNCMIAQTQEGLDKERFIKLPKDANLNPLIEDFLHDRINFAGWLYDAKSAREMPETEYRKRNTGNGIPETQESLIIPLTRRVLLKKIYKYFSKRHKKRGII